MEGINGDTLSQAIANFYWNHSEKYISWASADNFVHPVSHVITLVLISQFFLLEILICSVSQPNQEQLLWDLQKEILHNQDFHWLLCRVYRWILMSQELLLCSGCCGFFSFKIMVDWYDFAREIVTKKKKMFYCIKKNRFLLHQQNDEMGRKTPTPHKLQENEEETRVLTCQIGVL